jgi:hypothetical protein
MFYARKKLAKLVAWSQDYLNSVMRKSPPTPKPILDPGVLVIAIVIPPSKANTPTTAAVDRLTLPPKRLDRP